MRRLFLNSVLVAAFLVATSVAQAVEPNPPGFGGISGPGFAKKAVRKSEVPSTRIYVKTVPRGASIRIGDREHGKSDQLITLPETLIPKGATSVELTVKVFLDNRHTKNQRVKITRGRIQRVEFRFDEEEKTIPAAVPAGEERHPLSPPTVRSSYRSPPLPPMLEEEESPVIVKEEGAFHVSVLSGRSLGRSASIKKIIPDPDGGTLILYTNFSGLEGIAHYHLAHYNPAGKLDWKIKNLRNNQMGKDFLTCIRTPDGNYLLTGDEYDVTKDRTEQDFLPFATLVSSEGKIIPWKEDPLAKHKGHMILSVVASPRGGFLFAGTKILTTTWLYRIDAQGRNLWEKTFPQKSQPTQLSTCKDGGYFVAGHFFFKSPKDTYVRGLDWLCRIDEDGNLLWDTPINDKPERDISRVVETPDGFLTLIRLKDEKNVPYPCYLVYIDPTGNKRSLPIQQLAYDLDLYHFIYTPEKNLLSIACKQKFSGMGGIPEKMGLLHVDTKTGKQVGVSLLGSSGEFQSITPLGDEKYSISTNLLSQPNTPSASKYKRITTIRIEPKKKTTGLAHTHPATLPKPSGGVKQAEASPFETLPSATSSSEASSKYFNPPPPAKMKAEKIPAVVDDGQGACITIVSQKSLRVPGGFRKMVTDPDGGVLVVYSRHSVLQGFSSYHLAHYDAAGKLDWQNENIGDNHQRNKAFDACIRTPEGGYLLAGQEYDPHTEFWDNTRPFVIRISSTGEVLPWGKELWKGHASMDGFYVFAVTSAPDGGFLFAGTYHFSTLSNKREQVDRASLWFYRVDADGNRLWEKSFPQASQPRAIMTCSDGGFAISGQLLKSNRDIQNLAQISGSDVSGFSCGESWLCRLDKNGNLLWDRPISNGFLLPPADVVQTSDCFLTFTPAKNQDIRVPGIWSYLMHVDSVGKTSLHAITADGFSFDPPQAVQTSNGDLLAVVSREKRTKKDSSQERGLRRISFGPKRDYAFMKTTGMSVIKDLRPVIAFTRLSDGKYLIASRNSGDMAEETIFTTVDLTPKNAGLTEPSKPTAGSVSLPELPPAEMKVEKIPQVVDDKQGAGIAVVSQRSLSILGAVRQVAADPDGGVLVLYSRYSALQGVASYHLAHYNAAGKLDWRLEDIRNTSKIKEFRKPLRTARGDYLLYGEEHDFAKVADTDYEPFAIRVSAHGKILPWKNELRKKMRGYRVHAATPTPEGSFLFAGTHYYATPPSEKQEIEHAVLWLCQVDAEGKKLWEKSYPQSSRPLSISVCDGGYVIAGQLLTPAKVPLKERTLAMFESGPTWLCYLDRTGELLWDTRLSDEAYRLLSKVLPTRHGFLTFNHKTIKGPSKRTTFTTRLMYIALSGKKRSFSLDLKGISLNTRQAILTPTEDVLVIATKRQGDKKDSKSESGLLRIATSGQTLKKGMSIVAGLKSGTTIEPLSGGKCLLVSSGEMDQKTDPSNQVRKIVFTTVNLTPRNAKRTESPKAATTEVVSPLPAPKTTTTDSTVKMTTVKMTLDVQLPPPPCSNCPNVTTVWKKALPAQTFVSKIIADPDGGFLVVSEQISSLQKKAFYNLAHYRPDGTVDWQKKDLLDASTPEHVVSLVGVLRTSEGNYLVCGTKYQGTPIKKLNSKEEKSTGFSPTPFAIMISSKGEIVPWGEKLLEPYMGQGYQLHVAAVSEKGNFLFGGIIYSPKKEKATTAEETPTVRLFLFQVDANRKKLWEKTLPYANLPLSLLPCHDNGYIMGGVTLKRDADHDLAHDCPWLCRIEENGEMAWDISFEKDATISKPILTEKGEMLMYYHAPSLKTPSGGSAHNLLRISPEGNRRLVPLHHLAKNVYVDFSNGWTFLPDGKVLTIGRDEDLGLASGSLLALDPKTGEGSSVGLPEEIKDLQSVFSLGKGEYLIKSQKVPTSGGPDKIQYNATKLLKVRLNK